MIKNIKRIAAAGLSTLMLGSANLMPISSVITSKAADSGNVLEYLDRGISAINTGSGMLVSWRYLANDDDNATYKLYRDNTLIYTSEAGKSTCFLDKSGNAGSKYRVETYSGSKLTDAQDCKLISNNNYFQLPMSPPSSIHSPNDMSVGDVDGDGQYELFVKWDPSDQKDNSQKGKTSNVYIDCIRLDGTRLWRIDLGVNIRAGAHYTQFYVADYDLDGKAEMTCKTADGTKDGTGKYIGDSSANYRNGDGLIITGPEYYTLFDGATGSALHTIDYEPGRGDTTKWGKSSDKFNRVDRFWGTVAYLDGVHPCVVTGRGYYGRMTATAYKVENKKLVKMWAFDTGTSSSTLGYGDGNHNSMAADVDGDGKQEIITGATCIDDNGKLLWCTNTGHGDAMHLGDFLPDRKGIELWICHEDSPYGVSLIDASNGKTIFHKNGSGDTGRCCADNVWAKNPGGEFWGLNNDVFDGSGNTLSCRRPAINFLSYWDGDLEREILDGYTDSPATITKMKDDGTLTTLLSTDGYYTCNTTKGTPCLSADIFGDWREELIVRAADSKSIRIYCTPYDTDYRITTLMHDSQYRVQVSSQNTAYNQPPHASFYLGSDKPLPARPQGTVNGAAEIVTISAFETIEAENFSAQEGVRVEDLSTGGQNIGFIENGDYIGFNNVDFENGARRFTLKASGNPCKIELFTGSLSGTPATVIDFPGTSGFSDYQELSFNIAAVSGVKNIYLRFTGGDGYLMNMDSFVFGKNALPVNGKLIKELAVTDEENGSDWSIVPEIKNGELVFGDRDAVYKELPKTLEGAEYIRTACDSKNVNADLASFKAGADITVYVALDNRVENVPAWMSGFTKTDMTAVNDKDVVFDIYSLDMKNGDKLTLGSNGQSAYCVNYTVFVTATASEPLMGDVNMDGTFSIADVILLQKWLLAVPEITLENWENADYVKDNKLDVFDLVLMKRALLSQK